jgi:hypothetical protein
MDLQVCAISDIEKEGRQLSAIMSWIAPLAGASTIPPLSDIRLCIDFGGHWYFSRFDSCPRLDRRKH